MNLRQAIASLGLVEESAQVGCWSTLFFACAQVLSVFDIRPALGDDGREVENLHTFSAGLIAQLGPFGVDVTPRSETHAVMIEQLMEKYPWEDSNSNDLVGLNDNSW